MGIFTAIIQKLFPKKAAYSINIQRNSKAIKMSCTSSVVGQDSKEGYTHRYNDAGRRYHGNEDSVYMLPNDDDEADRLHQQHWILKYILDRNFLAPVTQTLEEGATVLDSACGPATWTFDLAETFPKSQFHGIDITGVFPDQIRPSNATFAIADVTKNVPYPDNTFDFIHQRLVVAALTSDNWTTALAELLRVLKPGGYLELNECDFYDMINIGPLWKKMQAATLEMFASYKMPVSVCQELKDRLIKAGFVNVTADITDLPMNHDGKRGDLFWQDMAHVYTNVRPALAKLVPEWASEEVFQQHLKELAVECKKHKSSIHWCTFNAQKPSLD